MSSFHEHQKALEELARDLGHQPTAREISDNHLMHGQVQYLESDADLLPPQARDRATLSGADLEGILRERQDPPQTLTATFNDQGQPEIRATPTDDLNETMKELLNVVRAMPDQIVDALRS